MQIRNRNKKIREHVLVITWGGFAQYTECVSSDVSTYMSRGQFLHLHERAFIMSAKAANSEEVAAKLTRFTGVGRASFCTATTAKW